MARDKFVKFSRLAYLLFFRRHGYPGCKDWELEKYLGRNYKEVIAEFNKYIEPLGLRVEEVEVEFGGESWRHYVVKPIYGSSLTDIKTSSLNQIDLAVLAVSLAYVLSSEGGVPKKEVVDVLARKFGKNRALISLGRLIRYGYLLERDDKLYTGLRTLLEIDVDKFGALLVGRLKASSETSGGD